MAAHERPSERACAPMQGATRNINGPGKRGAANLTHTSVRSNGATTGDRSSLSVANPRPPPLPRGTLPSQTQQDGRPSDNTWASHGRPTDAQWTPHGCPMDAPRTKRGRPTNVGCASHGSQHSPQATRHANANTRHVRGPTNRLTPRGATLPPSCRPSARAEPESTNHSRCWPQDPCEARERPTWPSGLLFCTWPRKNNARQGATYEQTSTPQR